MSAFDMGDLEGIITADMLVVILSKAEDLATEALLNFQNGGCPDGISQDEYEAEKEEQDAYIGAVNEVCYRIREKMEWNQATAEARCRLRQFCVRNCLDANGLQEMASDLSKGKTHGLIGNFGFWNCQGLNPESVAMFTEDGSVCFIPNEFWEGLEVLTGSNPFAVRNAQGGAA